MSNNIITLIGGGSSAHTLIPLLYTAGNTVNLYTRKPHLWSKEITTEYILPNGTISDKISGKIKLVSNNAKDVVTDADILILCMPVSKYREALHNTIPHINNNKKVYIGTIYGQGGFNWMVEEVKTKFNKQNIVTFACGLIPWICRIKEYGKIGITYGSKKVNYAAVSPKNEFLYLNKILFDDICYKWFKMGHFVQAENFISLTLSVDNQIIHPSRLLGLSKQNKGYWNTETSIPLFYKDYDKLSENILELIDEEYSMIRDKIIFLNPNSKFTYMLNYLDLERFSYGSNSKSIMQSFIESKTLGQIKTPTVKRKDGKFIINSDHRFFYDDIFYGLCIAKWIAQDLKIKTPTIDEILIWAQNILHEKILDSQNKLNLCYSDNKNFKYGIPSVYGFKSTKEILDI